MGRKKKEADGFVPAEEDILMMRQEGGNRKDVVVDALKLDPEFEQSLRTFTFKGERYKMKYSYKLFCMEVVRNGGNVSSAILAVGYSKNSIPSMSRILMSNEEVLRFIDALREDLAFRIGVSAEDIANEYKKIAFSNAKDLYDDWGRPKDVGDLTHEAAASIQEIQIIDTKYGEKRVVKRFDKIQALKNLSRMLGFEGEVKMRLTEELERQMPMDKFKDIEAKLNDLL